MYTAFLRDYTDIVPYHEEGETIVLQMAFSDRRMMKRCGLR